MLIEVLGRDGLVLASWEQCALCEENRAQDVFEGPGQRVSCCLPCLECFEENCSADPGEPLPHEFGWSDLDDHAQTDEYDWDRRMSEVG